MTTVTLPNLSSFIANQGIDALVLSKVFKQVNLTDDQAEAIAEAIVGSEKILEKRIESFEERNSKSLHELSTKGDLLIIKKELEGDLLAMKSGLDLKIDLKVEQVRKEIEQIRSDLIKWIAGLMIANTGLLFTLIKFFN